MLYLALSTIYYIAFGVYLAAVFIDETGVKRLPKLSLKKIKEPRFKKHVLRYATMWPPIIYFKIKSL
jgi:hypothetical protein